MAINTKKPAMKQTVGASICVLANTTEGGEYDGTYEADVEKTEVVKSVKVTENSETSDVYASGKIYDSDSPMSSIDIEVSVIAFPTTQFPKCVEKQKEQVDLSLLVERVKDHSSLTVGCKTEKWKISL